MIAERDQSTERNGTYSFLILRRTNSTANTTNGRIHTIRHSY